MVQWSGGNSLVEIQGKVAGPTGMEDFSNLERMQEGHIRSSGGVG